LDSKGSSTWKIGIPNINGVTLGNDFVVWGMILWNVGQIIYINVKIY
jgi:hypothetical protein